VKVSYSCTENIEKIIKNHNRKILSPKVERIQQECNCRNKLDCPMNGKCRFKNVIYKCIVTAKNQPKKVYIGLTEGEWKTRYNNHKSSFKNKIYQKATALSCYVWDLKSKFNETPTLSWSILKSVPPYSNISKKCHLCLNEKLAIISYSKPEELLNKRSEFISKCRHENKYLLKNYIASYKPN
jgi:hypothetical protein